MTFSENIVQMNDLLGPAGYTLHRSAVNLEITNGEKVKNYEFIARKDTFNIICLEATSNWRAIATELIKVNKTCLVITAFKKSHYILSVPANYAAIELKPRHVVIDKKSKSHSLEDFVKKVHATGDDTVVSIDEKMQKAFDAFSEYKEAIAEFGLNLHDVIKNTRNLIRKKIKNNKNYHTSAAQFLKMSKKVINKSIELRDIEEMLIQHILTYEIFSLLYKTNTFHNVNTVAQSLGALVYALKIKTEDLGVDYTKIKLVAESLTDVNSRQEFLHAVYETFYEKHNPSKAKKDGIVYTPSEVVSFMVKGTNYLLDKHFKKCLSDDKVTVLDPATGTGTFINEVMRNIKPTALKNKYENDLFANEISILPYYIAALNIENTYHELTGKSDEFENICWMDTLENGAEDFRKITSFMSGKNNVTRISRQQQKDICVVLGNPPYNAVQTSFNDTNPADKYDNLDTKIRETWSAGSGTTAKLKQYDMYKRFLKWASERIKNNGMVVFVSNNSFLDVKSDEGFRRSMYNEFDYIYTVNLRGNQNIANWRKEGGKVFGNKAKVGITISFFLKTSEGKSEIHYAEVDDYLTKEAKLKWLADNSLSTLPLRQIIPNSNAHWLNQTVNDFDKLVPVVSDEEYSVFGSRTHGTSSHRDAWVYDFDKNHLGKKINYFIDVYNKTLKKYADKKPTKNPNVQIDKNIKWSRDILKHLKRENKLTYSKENIKYTLYRPFVVKQQYFDKIITDVPGTFLNIFKNKNSNKLICFSNPKTNVLFQTLAVDRIVDLDCIPGTHCIPLHTYDDEPHSNITEFGLKLFQTHYKNKRITGEEIFYYTYAIFNDPKYSKKYEFNLQRKFPRIPLAKDFFAWVKIGKKLCDIHVGFESAEPYPLKSAITLTTNDEPRLLFKKPKNPKLEQSEIIIDDKTRLVGIPNEVLEYKFASKCALEWILDFYGESKNKISDKSCDDEDIRNRFNTYNFADHKEKIIDLLKKVTTVSLETVKLRKELEKMPWGPQPKLKLTDESSPKKKTNKMKSKQIPDNFIAKPKKSQKKQ